MSNLWKDSFQIVYSLFKQQVTVICYCHVDETVKHRLKKYETLTCISKNVNSILLFKNKQISLKEK
jgi:hypothetical protein